MAFKGGVYVMTEEKIKSVFRKSRHSKTKKGVHGKKLKCNHNLDFKQEWERSYWYCKKCKREFTDTQSRKLLEKGH